MRFLNFLFRKKQITYLGRGGLKYFDGKDDFYVDTSNSMQGSKLTVEIFREEIKRADTRPLTDLEKKRIAFVVKTILEKDDVNVVITPSLSMDFIIENS